MKGLCPVPVIATPWLATDAPDEGSGWARRGSSRLQHMSGSRGRRVSSLGSWPLECVVVSAKAGGYLAPRKGACR